MAKNRVKTNSRLLADIVLKPRSNAYKDLCAMCTDENGFQSEESDAVAARLRDELKSTLIDLLNARNLDAINEKLADKAPGAEPAIVALQVSEAKGHASSHDTFWKSEKIRVGNRVLTFKKGFRADATPEQLIYGVLRRSLESGDIARLALCEQCQKLFYRQSLKRDFCSDACRWTFHNHSPARKRQRISNHWVKKKDLR
jgi:hypothetical protein